MNLPKIQKILEKTNHIFEKELNEIELELTRTVLTSKNKKKNEQSGNKSA